MTDLRQAAMQALEQPEQEPVAWMSDKGSVASMQEKKMGYVLESAFTIPLYTAPPAAQPEPTCPKCKAAVLYECVACSNNNYPPATQPPPEWEAINNIIAEYGLDAIAFVAEWKAAQRKWQGLTDEDLEFWTEELGQGELGKGVIRAVADHLKESNT